MLTGKTKYFTCFLLLVLTPVFTAAQNRPNGTPVSFNEKSLFDPPIIHIKNTINIAKPRNEKEPMQAGYTLDVSQYNLNKAGIWDSISTSSFIWRLTYHVADAFALNLYLSHFNLQSGDRLFIYGPNKSHPRGAFTSLNNAEYLCTDFVEGDDITIELNTCKKKNSLPFETAEIGLKLPTQDEKDFGGAGICEVQVNCAEGDDWQQQKKGVSRILVKQGSQTFWCTGTLINNTRLDGTAYFLTANHCGETATIIDYSNWLFFFNYEAAGCEKLVIEPEAQTISGSKLLANSVSGTSAGSDFKLLLLNQNVPIDNPYYNGWNRSGDVSLSGVSIHHPQGDVKMISTFTAPLVSSYYNSVSEDPEGKYWRVYWSETQNGHGVTEGGSSGSPIFDQNGLVVGSLTGGGASCTFLDDADYYGKLSVSWQPTTVNDSTRVLSYWLDPDHTEVLKLPGSDLDTNKILAFFTTETTTILMGGSITFTNTSFGNISSYEWEFQGGEPAYSETMDPGNITYSKAGDYNVTLRAFSSSNADTLTREKYIHVMPNISPNPGNGSFKLAFGHQLPENIELGVFDAMGNKVKFTIAELSTNYLIFDMSTNRSGMYFIRFTSSDQNNSYKVFLIK